jgi:AcrR family transcriptional regulator
MAKKNTNSVSATAAQLPKGRHGLSREFVAHNQRERLIDAIANVVAEKGYAATRVVDITDYAGVSRKTFYELFTDKEDCFLQAYDVISGLMMDKLGRGLAAAESTWEAKVHALLGGLLEFMAAEPAFARMCIVEVLGSGPRGLARRDAAIEAFFPIIGALPEEELADADWLSPVTPMFIVGGVLEVIYGAIRRGETESLPDLEEDLTHLAFRSYLHPGEWQRVAQRGSQT